MQIGYLGPLEVRDGGRLLPVPGGRLQRLLLHLALDPGRWISAGALGEAVWDDPPADPANSLQSLVSRLRRALGRAELVEQSPAGYRLAVEPADVDQVVERTEGVTASFLKELVRRAVLESLTERPGALEQVTGAHLSRALDDLLDSTQTVTRALLGVPGDQSGPPMSAPMDRGHGGHGGIGWLDAGEYSWSAEPG